MISIGDTLVSTQLLKRKFVCDLNRCKGVCCVEGESGAPLEAKEAKTLEGVYKKVEPYLTPAGRKAIVMKGTHTIDADGDIVTPLVGDQGECAYAIFDNGIAKCGIEQAYADGVIRFRKPVSCHLYPVRANQKKHFMAVNYQKWEVCSPACELGKVLEVPVYKFVKSALVRKFGKRWYRELELVAKEYQSYRESK
jgi:Protein of unknown function (DUF3109)